MADPKIQIRRSSQPGKIPTTAQLSLGELAINSYDGLLFLKKSVNSVESIVQVNQSSTNYNLDGGVPGSTYGGITSIDAGGI